MYDNDRRPEYRNSTFLGMTRMRIGALLAGVVLTFMAVVLTPLIFEDLDAKEMMVVQAAGSGTLSCYTDPGLKPQWFGTVTTYPRRGTLEFDRLPHDTDQGNGKPIQFNDGGKGTIYGSVNYEMPLDCKQILAIHRTYGSKEGIEAQAVARMVNTAILVSGPMMSSTESSAERRAQLIEYINDQAQNGPYQTYTERVTAKDEFTGEERIANVVRIKMDAAGRPLRQQGSTLQQYGIELQPISVENFKYSQTVEDQIAKRQAAETASRIAQANARKAQQDAITAEEQGKANAAEAKWKQEVIKAQAVTEAQQKFEVAQRAAQEAAEYKKQQILIGEGDAERKRLVLAADGALEQKLAALRGIHQAWATAFSNYKGNIVPGVVMGSAGAGGNPASNAQAMLDIIGVKAARDLAVDMDIPNGAGVKK